MKYKDKEYWAKELKKIDKEYENMSDRARAELEAECGESDAETQRRALIGELV